jgi:hypothetical protein
MLGDDRCTHRFQGRVDSIRMQHGKEPSLGAPVNRRGPGVGSGRSRMAGQIEDVHHAFPYGPALECLTYGTDCASVAVPPCRCSTARLSSSASTSTMPAYITHGGGHAIGAATPTARHDPLRFFRALFPHSNNTSSRQGLENGETPPRRNKRQRAAVRFATSRL